MLLRKSKFDTFEYFIGYNTPPQDSKVVIFRNNKKINIFNDISEWISAETKDDLQFLSSFLYFRHGNYSEENKKTLTITKKQFIKNGPYQKQMFPKQFGFKTKKLSKINSHNNNLELLINFIYKILFMK